MPSPRKKMTFLGLLPCAVAWPPLSSATADQRDRPEARGRDRQARPDGHASLSGSLD
jgi:hypothetical protein